MLILIVNFETLQMRPFDHLNSSVLCCGSPPLPPSPMMALSHTSGATVATYRCARGHVMEGTESTYVEINCVSGIWEPLSHTNCKRIPSKIGINYEAVIQIAHAL